MAPLRASLARSPPRLGRSQAGGLHPRPPGLRPWRAFAHRAPAASVTQPEGSGHGCARWPGWSTACGCPRWTPSPGGFRASGEIQKVGSAKRCGGSGRAPVIGDGGQPGPGGGRSGCSRRLCPPSTDWARLSTGVRVQGAAVEAVSPPERQRWQRHATHRVRRKGRKPAPVLDPLHLWHASPTLVACQPRHF